MPSKEKKNGREHYFQAFIFNDIFLCVLRFFAHKFHGQYFRPQKNTDSTNRSTVKTSEFENGKRSDDHLIKIVGDFDDDVDISKTEWYDRRGIVEIEKNRLPSVALAELHTFYRFFNRDSGRFYALIDKKLGMKL